MIVIMWMNSVSQFRDKTLKLHADRAVDHFMEVVDHQTDPIPLRSTPLTLQATHMTPRYTSSVQIFSMNNIKCHLTSQALDSYKMNKGNRVRTLRSLNE